MNLHIFIFFSITFLLLSCNFKKINKKEDNLGRCTNPSGELVSWYIIYSLQNHYNTFVYIDNTLSNFKNFNAEKIPFPPLLLVKGINKREKYNYAIWNDDMLNPNTSRKSFGAHSKGIFAHDHEKSSLLIHSLPRFPVLKNDGKTLIEDMPENEGKFAQTFLCINMDNREAVQILNKMDYLSLGIQTSFVNLYKSFKRQLYYESALISENNILFKSDLSILDKTIYNEIMLDKLNLISKKKKAYNSVSDVVRALLELVNGAATSKERNEFTLNIKSDDDSSFVYFGKPRDNKYNLPYEEIIPNYFKDNLFVGTWTRPRLLDPICDKKYRVTNIYEYNILSKYRYSNNQDHSKWAVTEKDIAICIGDLNRTESQLSRGGAVMCLKNKLVSKQVKQFIIGSDICKDIDFQSSLNFLQ